MEKVKTLFPYIGKKPPRIGREVVEAFKQSACEIFVDLFCGSLALLCYLPWDVKVVVNDIDGNLTNLYLVIRDRPSGFVSAVMKLPYSEVVFQKFKEALKVDNFKSDFSNANKLAQFASIAPLHLLSSGKGKDRATKQGNRRLQATICFLAIQMVQVSSKGTP